MLGKWLDAVAKILAWFDGGNRQPGLFMQRFAWGAVIKIQHVKAGIRQKTFAAIDLHIVAVAVSRPTLTVAARVGHEQYTIRP